MAGAVCPPPQLYHDWAGLARLHPPSVSVLITASSDASYRHLGPTPSPPLPPLTRHPRYHAQPLAHSRQRDEEEDGQPTSDEYI